MSSFMFACDVFCQNERKGRLSHSLSRDEIKPGPPPRPLGPSVEEVCLSWRLWIVWYSTALVN